MKPLTLLLTLYLLVACAASPPPAPDLSGWHEVYRRPGWSSTGRLDLRAVGDLMLARHVATRIERSGMEALLAPWSDLLAGDLTLANLESPLTQQREQLRPGPYRLVGNPDHIPALAAAGIDALSLANNHALDAGLPGLADTYGQLQASGITVLGTGENEAAALTPHIQQVNGLHVALLALNDVADPADGPGGLARADDPTWRNPDTFPWGRAWLSDAALEAVRSSRAQADLVVIMVHWGVEYSPEPSARQRAWAERLVAAGADLVIGSHPHVVQPVEVVETGDRRGVVAYSLGNFIFDGPADPTQNSGMALRVLCDQQGVALVATAPLDLDTTAPTTLWRWDGNSAQIDTTQPHRVIPAHPTEIVADLRGNGVPLTATLSRDGQIHLYDAGQIVWENESPAWRFSRMVAGDPNDDGRVEVVMLLWQPDASGQLRSQPYILGWRGGRYQIIWGGSPTPIPIQDMALGDLEGDGRTELIVLEGGNQPGDPGESVSVWRWHGWGFQREWRSAAGRWARLGLVDVEGDGVWEIVGDG